jgi:signal transduction histidine kinase
VRQRRFVADASHELRTPVTVIRSKTDLALLQVFPPEDYLGIFCTIHTEAKRLGRLISDLQALARADEGQVHLEREVVQLDLLVEAVAATVEPLAVEHGVTLEVKTTEPVSVLGDEARLMQVVMNLLENAIRYSNPKEHVLVAVQVEHTQACLVVRDTGIGIAPEHRQYLFDRFYQVDAARIGTEGGNSGLGLAIVDWIVKAHDGSIQVESQVGQGSTFTVLLPLHMAV